MTDVSRWLGTREPRPPGDLAEACAAVDRAAPAPENMAFVLREAAAERLSSALARPGRVRESAFDLLVADALVTYACEAALEDADVEAALGRLVGIAGGAG